MNALKAYPRRFRDAVALLALCAAAGMAPADGGGLDPDEQRQFADGLYSRRLYDLAAAEYASFLKKFPRHKDVDVVGYRLGECYRSLGRPTDAEPAYERVFALPPSGQFYAWAGYRLSQIRNEAGKTDSAVEVLKKLLKEKLPDDIEAAALYDLGDGSQKLGRPDEAAAVFEDLIRKHQSSPFMSPALVSLGSIYTKQKGKEDRAAELFKAATEKPASERLGAEAWFQFADIHMRRKNHQEALRAFEKLLSLYPKDERAAAAALQSAWSLHNLGQYAEALKRAEAVVDASGWAQNAFQGDWLYLAANCRRQTDKKPDAVKTYDRLLKEFPAGRFAKPATYEAALVLFKLGDFEHVVGRLAAFAPTDDLRKDTHWLLAESYAALKRDEDAIGQYRAIAKQYPADLFARDSLYKMGYLLQKRGEFAEASKQYLALVDAFPKSELAPQALFASAQCMNAAKKTEEALRDWSALVRQYPESQFVEESLYQKAMAESQLKKDSDMEATFRDLLKRFPNTKFAAEAHYLLGILLKESGRDQEAEIALRAVLALKPREDLLAEAMLHLGLLLQKLKKTDESADLLQAVLSTPARAKVGPSLLEWLAEYRHERKDYVKAAQAAQFLAESADKPEWQQIGWCLTGRSLLAHGQPSPAQAAYRKALEIKLETEYAAESALRLGQLSYGSKDHEMAQKFFEQAAAMASRAELLAIRAHAYAGLARVMQAQGKLDEAAKHYLSVAILFDDAALVPECLYEASEVFKQLGRAEHRQQVLKELATRYPASEWAKRAAAQQQPQQPAGTGGSTGTVGAAQPPAPK